MKSKKIISLIILSVLLGCGIAYLTCYLTIKEDTINFTHGLVDFINKPLPIVGISLAIIGAFVLRLVAMSSWGKKQASLFSEKTDTLKKELEEEKCNLIAQQKILEESLKEKEEEIKGLEKFVCELCSKIPNKKVQNYIKEYNNGKGKETINS